MDDILRQERIRKARVILNHRAFTAADNKGKEAIMRSLLEKGLDLDDLRMLKPELLHIIEATPKGKSGFDKLDVNAISLIFMNMKPKEVLSTCTTNRHFAHICQDINLFRSLLGKHYPDDFVTNNPRQQYAALTEGVESTYKLHIISQEVSGATYELEGPVLIGKSSRPELTPGWSVRNIGTQNFLEMLRNPIFLGWLSKNKRLLQEFSTAVDRIRTIITQRLMSIVNYDYLDRHFKDFIADYRPRGAEAILAEEGVQESLRLRMIPMSIGYRQPSGREELDKLLGVLKEARSAKYKSSHGTVVFSIAGNSLPTGTVGWSIIQPRRATDSKVDTIVVKNSREAMARYFAHNFYAEVGKDLISAFILYVHANRPEFYAAYERRFQDILWSGRLRNEDLEWVEKDPAMVQHFGEWLALAKDLGLTTFSTKSLYEYAMTHERFETLAVLFLFRELTF